ncbi:myb-like protein x-like [Diplodia corticola]|uniref:Myb-like protein x-like n=1 Tax=Diplodia corticola TaxID=236234 RepID=A0A1J9QKP5_9PEZI|nr:myb-like protein x-like [Diplodia corticola]OJD29446.1 myb-like protein x-like [Diplodia corticola]
MAAPPANPTPSGSAPDIDMADGNGESSSSSSSSHENGQEPRSLSDVFFQRAAVENNDVAFEMYEMLKELEAKMAADKRDVARQMTEMAERLRGRHGKDGPSVDLQRGSDGEPWVRADERKKLRDENAALREELEALREECKTNSAAIAKLERFSGKEETIVRAIRRRQLENESNTKAVDGLEGEVKAAKEALAELDEFSRNGMRRHDSENVAIRKEGREVKDAVKELREQSKANREGLDRVSRTFRREINELKREVGTMRNKSDEGVVNDCFDAESTIRVAPPARRQSTSTRTPTKPADNIEVSDAAFLDRVSYNAAASMTNDARTNAFINYLMQEFEVKGGARVSHNHHAKARFRDYAMLHESSLVAGDKHIIGRTERNFWAGCDLTWALNGDTLDKYTQRREAYGLGYH